MSGPSKYDDLARNLKQMLGADAVVLVVINGTKGSGACPALRVDGTVPFPELQRLIVRALREIADGMEQGIEPGRVDWNEKES